MSTIVPVLTWLAALGAALIAGAFFAFSSFVMGALGRLPAPQGIAAMQSINVVVINPIFLGVFAGTAIVCVLLAIAAIVGWGQPGAIALLAGAALYVVGTFIVTMTLNVPLNDALAAADPASDAGAELWGRYLADWTRWNTLRTVGSLGALGAFIVALRQAAVA
jgi:uncharacterized membrane protein